MSEKSDYFFVNIKQIYPNFKRPSALETEVWEELLEPYTVEDILAGIKSYRKNEDTGFAPNPAKFTNYLYSRSKTEEKADSLPLSPEQYLMDEDIRAGRCKYFYPVYCKAVNYILDVKTRELCDSDAAFKKLTRGQRYRLAVDNGLFAKFDEVLDYVYKQEAH